MFLKLRSPWGGGVKGSIGCDNMNGRSKKKDGSEGTKKICFVSFVEAADERYLVPKRWGQ